SALEILTFIAIINGSRVFLSLLIPFLLFFGTIQFLFVPFEGEFLLFHLEHLVMSISIVYILLSMFLRFQFIRFAIGFFIGSVFLIVFILFFQLDFFKKNTKYLRYVPYIENVLKKGSKGVR
ncbi:MAG: hypothetical protein DRI36_06220, partial [Caldiserica bacterium]